MAHSDACQIFIEEQIKEGLAQGKNPYSIGKELTAMIERMFEASIPVETLRTRARRMKGTLHYKKSDTGQMTSPPSTPENHAENQQKAANHEIVTPHESMKNPEKAAKQVLRDEKGHFIKPPHSPGRPPKHKQFEFDPLLNRHSDAMYFATIAISQLRRIMADDPDRVEALQKVKDWITENM